MLNIGEFARLGPISPRMLRHYDETGLVTPARVDPHTGYRWYDISQLRRLHRLLALRDLGFSLDQSRSVLDDDLPSRSCGGCCGCGRPGWSGKWPTSRLASAESKPTSSPSKGA